MTFNLLYLYVIVSKLSGGLLALLGIYLFYNQKFQRDPYQMMGIACIWEGIYIWLLFNRFIACRFTDIDFVVTSINFLEQGYTVFNEHVT